MILHPETRQQLSRLIALKFELDHSDRSTP